MRYDIIGVSQKRTPFLFSPKARRFEGVRFCDKKQRTKAAGLCLRSKMRRMLTRAKKDSILREANFTCLYCGDPANEVDHIFPHSYSLNDKEENLVASCSICNRIASDKVFDGFIAKQTYIREEREKKRWAKAIREYRSLWQGVGRPVYTMERVEDSPKKKEVKPVAKKKKGRRKPKLPAPFKSQAGKEPKPLEIVYEFVKKRRPRRKKPSPAFDYSNLEAYQTLFLVKYEKENTYSKVAAQYGLTPETVSMIAEGQEPGNEIREKLNLPATSGRG